MRPRGAREQLVVPDASIPSDEDEQHEPPRSQYRLARAQEAESSENSRAPVSADAMCSTLINVGCDFIAQVEDARKRDLVAHKLETTRKAPDFDEFPHPRRDPLTFTQQRRSRDLIPASQDELDYERDSVGSLRSIRKRLQQKTARSSG